MGEAKELEEEAVRLVDEAMELQDAAAVLVSMTWKEEQAIWQCALTLETDLKCLRSSFNSVSKKNLVALDPKTADKMFLGLVNVRATRKEVQLKVKEEYNSYRV